MKRKGTLPEGLEDF
nr:unnamed protein product [Callosobruchus chinensis]